MSRLHIVVGGGSSGLALARKLLEQDDVILIERGEIDHEQSLVPQPTWFETIVNIYPSVAVWCYRAFVDESTLRLYTEPQYNLLNRRLCYAQGYGRGGSGGINAMIYTLGNSLIYNKMWPKVWNYDRIKNSLTNLLHHYTPTVVNTSGNVKLILQSSCDRDTSDDRAATVEDDKSIVTSYYTTIHSSGTNRLNQASALLNKAHKGKLTIVPYCSVMKIQFDGHVATSLLVSRRVSTTCGKYSYGCQTITPERGGEIILCAGAFESPRILLASGLGASTPGCSATAVTEVGSDTSSMIKEKRSVASHAADKTQTNPIIAPSTSTLPSLVDIGQNLQDHCVLPYMLLGNWHSQWRTFHAQSIPHYAHRPAYPLNGVHGWVNLAADGSVWREGSKEPPSVQLLFIDGRVSASIIPNMLPRFAPGSGLYSTYIYPVLFTLLQYVTSLAVVRWMCGYFFGILVCLTQPKSRGSLRVNPSDPTGPLLIDPNYLAEPADLQALYQGLQTARRMVHRATTAPRSNLHCVEILPGPLFAYAHSWDMFCFFARMLTNPYYHACGTCAMRDESSKHSTGEHEDARHNKSEESEKEKVTRGVVDVNFTVLGVKKLRVADASVIPAIPSSPTQALCMVLGEACGDLILKEK